MSFEKELLKDYNFSSHIEWLDTNGIGGYASSTIAGVNTRRYHGLLVAAMHPPVGKMVILSKLEEAIISDDVRHELSSNQYPGAIHPTGFTYLDKYNKDLFPEFNYKVGSIEFKKIIVCIQGENTTVIIYEVIEAKESFQLELLPLYSGRDFHSVAHANDSIGQPYLFQDGIFRTLNYQGCPELFIQIPDSTFIESKKWYYNFEYLIEQERGLEYTEDLFTHGSFSVELKSGSKVGIIISTEDPVGRDAFQLFDQEKTRRKNLLKSCSDQLLLKRLVLAADQFIVKRGNLKTIIAGYHWFSDWGRDTMIALPGLCLATSRYEDAKNILQEFANTISEGMLPNRFPDHGEAPEYNTLDATLWFFQATYQYYQHTKDKTFILAILPKLKAIVDWHYKGTRFSIHVDPEDELLYGGQEGIQLTWMDAKVGDWVVTPRIGKPVEINALWYNALSITEYLLVESGMLVESEEYKIKASKVKKSFTEKFWNKSTNCLYDCINGEEKDASIRPNQIYAVSLPYPLLTKSKAEKVLEVVKKNLLTPVGLRSLNREHSDYKPTYRGDPWHRDGAYHQGTVWSFLLGAYIDALLSVKKNNGRLEAIEIIKTFLTYLDNHGLNSVPEIFDAEPPHAPRGCMAQAWGVGEILRVILAHNLMPTKKEVE